MFNLTTPLRLLELANPAQPLLKRLLQVAPGTYNHSIQMGNLAEAAAEAIGANPLLARVGAYYHDIGKTVRPEYFVENQIYVDNPHNRLNPNLSKLAITAHVRDGEHLARVYGLPQPVVDIIKQHHGTSVLAYFYHKALESSKEPVYEESYRYEEQKPRSKEASIVMLADSVEAAARAMQNPTRRKLQGMIQEIIKQKVEDGQLDESDLTQGDLHKIRESFDMSLRGLVGHRIAIPNATGRLNGAGPPRARPKSEARKARAPGSASGSRRHRRRRVMTVAVDVVDDTGLVAASRGGEAAGRGRPRGGGDLRRVRRGICGRGIHRRTERTLPGVRKVHGCTVLRLLRRARLARGSGRRRGDRRGGGVPAGGYPLRRAKRAAIRLLSWAGPSSTARCTSQATITRPTKARCASGSSDS